MSFLKIDTYFVTFVNAIWDLCQIRVRRLVTWTRIILVKKKKKDKLIMKDTPVM